LDCADTSSVPLSKPLPFEETVNDNARFFLSQWNAYPCGERGSTLLLSFKSRENTLHLTRLNVEYYILDLQGLFKTKKALNHKMFVSVIANNNKFDSPSRTTDTQHAKVRGFFRAQGPREVVPLL